MEEETNEQWHLAVMRKHMEYLYTEGVVVIIGCDHEGFPVYRAKTQEEIQAEIYEILNS